MKVHDLFVALSQQDRGAEVTIKNGKLHVGGKRLKVEAGVEAGDESEHEEGEGQGEGQ